MVAVQILERTGIGDETAPPIEAHTSCFRPGWPRRSARGRRFFGGLQGSCPRRVGEHLRQNAWELAS